MQWDAFIQVLNDADKKMSEIRFKLPKFRHFLKKSYPVITFENRQVAFKNAMSIFDLVQNMELLENTQKKEELVRLINCLTEAEAIAEESRRKSPKMFFFDEAEQIKNLKIAISTFPLAELEIIDEFDIYIVFPSINKKAIQTVKLIFGNHKTCMCLACIRVFIV